MQRSEGLLRKRLTRFLATGALLGIYALSTVGVTAVVMTTGMSPAMAQRGRDAAAGRGRGRGRGYGGAAVGAGIAAGIIGGAIIADQARRSNAVEYCMSRFRSYNPEHRNLLHQPGRRASLPVSGFAVSTKKKAPANIAGAFGFSSSTAATARCESARPLRRPRPPPPPRAWSSPRARRRWRTRRARWFRAAAANGSSLRALPRIAVR